jgi:hypothetical protein
MGARKACRWKDKVEEVVKRRGNPGEFGLGVNLQSTLPNNEWKCPESPEPSGKYLLRFIATEPGPELSRPARYGGG